MLRIAIVYDSCNIILNFYALRFYPSYRNLFLFSNTSRLRFKDR